MLAHEKSKSDRPLAAIVIEPTQQSTGKVVNQQFIRDLHSIAKDFEAALVVDETSTCCFASGSGHFWQYYGSADYVTFGKRTQVAGFYSDGNHIRVAGNENDVNLFGAIVETINSEQLGSKAKEAASKLSSSLASIQSIKGVVSARNSGANLWLELNSEETADKLISHLRSNGVIVSRNGKTGIVTKPSLVVKSSHIEDFVREIKKF